MREVIAIINQKGGVGKSTTVHAMGAALRLKGFKTLFIDLDAQGNLTHVLNAGQGELTVMDILTGQAPAAAVIETTPQGDVIPHSPALTGADTALTATGKEFILKEALAEIQDRYDYILIDTPPALGILTINALTAATAAVIPAQADIFSLQGISQLSATLAAVRKYTNPGLKIAGIVLTRYNNRTVLSRDIADMIADMAAKLDTKVFAAKIREGVALRETQVYKQDIFSYAPKSNAAADYRALVAEMLAHAKN